MAAVRSRVRQLINAFDVLGASPALSDAAADSIVKSLLRAEKRKPGASVASEGKWCLQALLPLAAEFQDLQRSVFDWTEAEQADALWKLHRAAGNPSRTVGMLENSVSDYSRMAHTLFDRVRGFPSLTAPRVWFTRNSFPACVLWAMSALWLGILQFPVVCEALMGDEVKGARKVRFGIGGVVIGLMGCAYRRYGPWGWRRRNDGDPDDDDALFGGPAVPQDPPPLPPPVEAPPDVRPRNAPVPPGMAVPAPPEQPVPVHTADTGALRAFAEGTTGTGPISATAARQAQGGAAGSPAMAGVGSGTYHPFDPSEQATIQQQAGALADLMLERSLDGGVNWAWDFWSQAREMQLHPAVKALMDNYGLSTPGHLGPPPRQLGKDLAQLRRNGMGHVPTSSTTSPVLASAALRPEELRYDMRLDPELRRAAPDIYIYIYRKLRTQGASSARDWLLTNLGDSRKDHRWADLWQAAVTVDFALASCPDHGAVMSRLATDDVLELHLRRLASYVYEKRTRDTAGAATMLALPSPGSGADIGPEWMISAATIYSREEFRRADRQRQLHNWNPSTDSGRGGGGGDRGRARGRGTGASSSQEQPPADGDGGGAARGGGRGSGGRRGRGRGRS